MKLKRRPLALSLGLLLAGATAAAAAWTIAVATAAAPYADTIAPSQPTNVQANVTATGADLTWTASTDNEAVTGYKVYVGGVPQDAATTAHTLSDLTPGRTYYIQVSAVDMAGNESLKSARLPVRTSSDSEAPLPPADLAAGSITANSAKMSWTASTDNIAVAGYDVYLDTIKQGRVTDTTYTLSGLHAERAYTFAVVAVDAAANRSDEVKVPFSTTGSGGGDTTPPSVPEGLAATATATSVSLSWDDSIDDVALKNYDVYRGADVVDTVTGTSAMVSGLMPDTAYRFSVRARDTSDNVSEKSTEITVITEADDGSRPSAPRDLYSGRRQTDDSGSAGVATIDIVWTAPTRGTVDHYKVYINNTLTDTVTSTSYSATGLVGNGNYTFKVAAVDGEGRESEPAVRWIQTLAKNLSENVQVKILTRSSLDSKEETITDANPYLALQQALLLTLDNSIVEQVVPGRGQNPENVKRVEGIITPAAYEHIFDPYFRNSVYSYVGLLRAIAKFPGLCGTYTDGRDSDAICRNTLATMIAHFAQETGAHDKGSPIDEWRQGLTWVREGEWEPVYTEDTPNAYAGECALTAWQGHAFPCGVFPQGHAHAGQFRSYFGRGAKQLSYNYNYGPFSRLVTGEVNALLDDPAQVAETWLNMASAVFFYLAPQSPKPSMLSVIDGTWVPNAADIAAKRVRGFGATIQIINAECTAEGQPEKEEAQNRINYYRAAAGYLNVPIDEPTLGCAGMQQFDSSSSAAVDSYWEQDWSWDNDDPDGKPYACQIVNYQTPHTALIKGDYAECVKKNFPNVLVRDDS